MQKSEIQIVWFKRDLRTIDHKPLFEASKTLKPILPIYVVENEYWKQPFSNKRHWCFIYDSLIELRKELKKLGQSLIVRIGSVTEIFSELSTQFNIISILQLVLYLKNLLGTSFLICSICVIKLVVICCTSMGTE